MQPAMASSSVSWHIYIYIYIHDVLDAYFRQVKFKKQKSPGFDKKPLVATLHNFTQLNQHQTNQDITPTKVKAKGTNFSINTQTFFAGFVDDGTP